MLILFVIPSTEKQNLLNSSENNVLRLSWLHLQVLEAKFKLYKISDRVNIEILIYYVYAWDENFQCEIKILGKQETTVIVKL